MMLPPSHVMIFSSYLFFKWKHCGMRYNRDEGLKKWGSMVFLLVKNFKNNLFFIVK